jgi:hypothetical protein
MNRKLVLKHEFWCWHKIGEWLSKRGIMRKSIVAVFCFLILLALACTSSQYLQPLSPFEQTRVSLVDTATAYAATDVKTEVIFPTLHPSVTVEDPFALTATSIVATATALSREYADGCRNMQVITQFNYRYEDNYQEPHISENDWANVPCDHAWKPPYEYQIILDGGNLQPIPKAWIVPVLEDAVSRLPDYPPFNGNTSTTIVLMSYMQRGTMIYTRFSYADAVAAYESGLRGEALARELGLDDNIDLTSTVEIREAVAYETARARDFELRMTVEAADRATYAALYTPDAFALTATSLVTTATAREMILASTPCATPEQGRYEFYHQQMRDHVISIDILVMGASCIYQSPMLLSHLFVISIDSELREESLYFVLDSALGNLSSYPPPYPEFSETIAIVSRDINNFELTVYGTFTYTDAIAAYESSLRGADLAEALGVHAP